MQQDNSKAMLILYDDREVLPGRLRTIAGQRNFGNVRVRNESLFDRFETASRHLDKSESIRIQSHEDLVAAQTKIAEYANDRVVVVASRAAISSEESLAQILLRFELANVSIVDNERDPLLALFADGKELLALWELFEENPLHHWQRTWPQAKLLEGPLPYHDVSKLDQFLDFISGATTTRHFNSVSFDDLIFKKKSSDVKKIEAEYRYNELIPVAMRAWMVTPFDFKSENGWAEYSMLRHYFADASFQWVHHAWSFSTFSSFLDRAVGFLDNRPGKTVNTADIDALAEKLFITKVKERWEQLRSDTVGAQILDTLQSGPGGERIASLLDEYFGLFEQHRKRFSGKELVIGHGDPCLSNILFEPETMTLRLIDPKGAFSEEELWTHPLYDYCKLSHSIIGNYDFINNKLFAVVFDSQAVPQLKIHAPSFEREKRHFRRRISDNVDWTALRLGEASLFLSMTPLHIDHPDKVAAFILNARKILDQINGATP